jgi:hypothetical protein
MWVEKRLGVDARRNRDARVRVPRRVEAKRLQPGAFPSLRGSAAKGSRVEREARIEDAGEQEPFARVIQEDQVIDQQSGQAITDRGRPRSPRLGSDELPCGRVTPPPDMQGPGVEVNCRDVERQELADA